MSHKSPTQPHCRMCDKAIPKKTESHFLRLRDSNANPQFYTVVDALPKTQAECQKLTNHKVVSVRYSAVYDDVSREVVGREMSSFNTWDGESYVDEHFCNGNCCRRFAYMVAHHYPTVMSRHAAEAARKRKKGEAA